MAFELSLDLIRARQIAATLVDKLLENGYSEETCGKFLVGNLYRIMKQIWI